MTGLHHSSELDKNQALHSCFRFPWTPVARLATAADACSAVKSPASGEWSFFPSAEVEGRRCQSTSKHRQLWILSMPPAAVFTMHWVTAASISDKRLPPWRQRRNHPSISSHSHTQSMNRHLLTALANMYFNLLAQTTRLNASGYSTRSW